MADSLQHRGPDAGGFWDDHLEGIALGHRRLAILDLTSAGSQPMMSPCGRWAIVFNGEIYNHRTLRARLKEVGAAPIWRGVSDTETLLAAVAHWGLKEALRRAYGMFALAVWDKKLRQLHLARDRMGEKPLYLANYDGTWLFASELRALLAIPSLELRLNKHAVAEYLAYGYVPEGHCIFEGVQKVPPGHIVTILPDSLDPHSAQYETFQELAAHGLKNRVPLTTEAAIKQVEATLLSVVSEQMLSDVPLGCFLSGGIDSSVVAALMQSQRDTPISTFSIGFEVTRFNEAPHAAAVAQHLRTKHTEFILTEADALATVPDLAEVYDEPFADSSQIPTVLLAREARRSVSVALTGDGGDEVFGGYNRYIFGPQLLRNLRLTPHLFRRQLARCIGLLAPYLTREQGLVRSLSIRLGLPPSTIDKIVNLAFLLAKVNDRFDLYQAFSRVFHDTSALTSEPPGGFSFSELTGASSPLTFDEWMMAMDSVGYLPGDILVKVDRAAMAASLETRTPFLDARVVQAAWALPQDIKISNRCGKRVLRYILDRHVPRSLFERPKQGFAVPLDQWLRGSLREWAHALLKEEALLDLAGLAPAPIIEMWHEHQEGKVNHSQKLWCILMLLAWLKARADRIATK